MIEEREALMLSPHENGEGICTLRNAHFLKPTLKPNIPFPKHPCISLTSKSHITLLKTMISFNCKSQSQTNWVTWVDTMTQTHQKTWQKVGIFDAIKATTCKFKNHNELILGLAEKWNPETNTFIFPFGEATVTLEDVMILGGYSVLGECVATLTQTGEVEEIKRILMSPFLANGSNDSTSLVQQSEWIGNFMDFGGELEHIAFLVLWLSQYVFPLSCYNNNYICPHVFPVAVALARGTAIALAPAILAAIYRDLRLLKAKIVDFVGQGKDNASKLVLSAPFQLVQWWVWERFTVLSPKPASSPCGQPRVARWPNFRKTKVSLFRFEFESLGECFLWKPYALYVTNKEFYEFYCDEGKSIVINFELELSDALVSFARCLRPCELVGLDTIEQYLPHRVGMQFGFDQDIPCPVSRCNQSVGEAWSSYTKPLNGKVLTLLSRLVRGEVSTRYNDWWNTESYHCNMQIRRSKRIARIRSHELNVNSPRQYEKRATICLTSSSNIASESSFVNGGQEMHIGKSPTRANYVNDCENGDNCNSIRVEVVLPSPSQPDIPKSSQNYIRSADAMDIETTPTIPNTCHVENVDSEIIPSQNGTRAGDIFEDAPSQNLKRLTIDLPSEDNNAASDVGCSKLPEGKKLVFPKQTLRNGSQCDPLLIEDDENDNEDKRVKAIDLICSEFEGRMCKLEATVSKIKAAKFRSKGKTA